MFKIAICDDNVQELESTYNMVLEFAAQKTETGFNVRRFQSSYDLMDCLHLTSGFHLYILDIIMPVMNGIDVGERIREKDENAIIIYLTSSPDYAVKSFRVFPFQYLMKPVVKSELFTAIEKTLAKMDLEAEKSLPVKTKDGITAIRYHQITYVEYSNHCLKFHLSDGSVVTSVSSREPFDTTANQLLKDDCFLRPHISFVVNLNYVRTITGKDFIMYSSTVLAISRNNYTDIKKRYIDFLLKGEHKC